MEKERYMISDAAKLVSLEQHVLRYWEEELQLHIPRNEMGHRYYTKENIEELQKIKELREQGYQLKAIRMFLKVEKEKTRDKESMELVENQLKISDNSELANETKEAASSIKLEQFQVLMNEIVGQALRENNAIITEHVEERILKEMNYLMKEHNQMEMDQFSRLDQAIREGIHKRRAERKGLFTEMMKR